MCARNPQALWAPGSHIQHSIGHMLARESMTARFTVVRRRSGIQISGHESIHDVIDVEIVPQLLPSTEHFDRLAHCKSKGSEQFRMPYLP